MKLKNTSIIFCIFLLIFSIFLTGCGLGGSKITEETIKTEKETIKIGVVIPLTGGMGFIGEGSRDSMLLAREKLEDTKYNYELLFEDNRLDNKETATVANKLMNLDKVDAIVTATSGPGNVVAPLAQENKVIHIGFATDPNVAIGEYNFIHWTPPEEENKVFVEELQRRGIKRLAIFELNQQGIKVITDDLKNRLEETDTEIVFNEIFNFGDTDFKTAILKSAKTNPDVYVPLAFSPELELIVKQIKESGITKPIHSIEVFEYTEQPELFEGWWYVNAADPTDEFKATFREKYEKDPVLASANAYDAFNLFVTAYEAAGKDSSKKPTNEDVVKELQKIKNFDGALGNLNVLDEGIVHSKAVIREVRNGEFVTIRS